MMIKYYLLTLACLISFTFLYSETNNTINIDGVNSGWAADETFTNCSAADNSYFTWDSDNIYIGISDEEVDYDNMATFIYFDVDPTGSNGSTDAYAWTDYITTPFNADWVFVIKNGLTNPSDYMQVMQYNNTNSTWEEAYSVNGAIFILDGGGDTVVKFSMGADYREFKISRSVLGNPEAIKTCMFTEQQWDSYWRYFTWPSDGWTDAGRANGQSIPNYYGFILEENITPYSAPYFSAAITEWTGNSSNSWSLDANWTGGSIPDQNTLVILPSDATTSIAAAGATCYDLYMNNGGVLDVANTGDLSVTGNLYNKTGASGVTVGSSNSGNGILIVDGEATGDITAQCFMTDAQWHTFSAPVNNQTAQDLYLNASPEVWLLEYTEGTDDYTFISAFEEPLTTMKGWMVWIGASSDHTYNFEGPMHTGTVGSDNNMVRTQAGGYGYNFVGNPFTAPIDWDATEGWTKTNLNNAIYIFNNGNWSTYINGAATNQGSRYIAMNQGFFVQVSDGAGAYPEYGTLKLDSRVCTTTDVNYLKSTYSTQMSNLVRLKLSMYDNSDETVIRFDDNATQGFDGEFDAHKMFSYSENKPLIYSSENYGMSINTLPTGITEVPIDVKGIHNMNMTLSASELIGVGLIYLKDNLTGDVVDLSVDDYSFKYDQNFTERFLLTAIITDIQDTHFDTDSHIIAYSDNRVIHTIGNDILSGKTFIFSSSGVKLYESSYNGEEVAFKAGSPGLYIVVVEVDGGLKSQKVIVY